MAEVVQLSIEYSTMGAQAQIRALELQLAKLTGTQAKTAAAATLSAGAFRGAGLGAVKMAEAMATGSISAVGLASSLGRVASIIFGPVGIALALGAAAFQLFSNQTKKADEQTKKFEDQLRDTQRRVDDLLHPTSSDPFAKEIQRITDEIDKLNEALAKGPTLWQKLMAGFAIAAATMFGTKIPEGVLDPQGETRRQRDAMVGQRGQLTPEAALKLEQDRFALANQVDARARFARGEGGIAEAEAQIRLLNEHIDNLAKLGNVASSALREQGQEYIDATRALEAFTRKIRLMEDLMFRIADSIEELVVTGTFAFQQFIENIFRTLYRDFTGNFIEDLIRSAGGQSSNATGIEILPAAGPSSLGGPPTVSPSMQSNVTFNVQAMDAQSVAAFFEREGGRIASTVAKQAARSKSLRTQFAR